MRIIAIIGMSIVVTISSVAIYPQEPSKAVLVDEFSILPCDDFLGRLDVYLSELKNAPANKGHVIIRNQPGERHRSVFIQESIKAHLEWRGWKGQPLEYVRADKDGKELVQFWRLPPGSEEPELDRRI